MEFPNPCKVWHTDQKSTKVVIEQIGGGAGGGGEGGEASILTSLCLD